jgi:hypothetical protein
MTFLQTKNEFLVEEITKPAIWLLKYQPLTFALFRAK